MSKEPALKGVTVLDLGQIYNGPYATFLMAMAGARVIKIESLVGEALRSRGKYSSAAYPFMFLNQNKESVCLDLKSGEGKEIFLSLVKKADVVLENFSPDTMNNLGLGASRLLEENSRLIYAAGSGYGREGEHRDFLAMDITVQAMAGIMSVTGTEEMPPLKTGAALCDFFGGIHLYGAIVTALLRRETTGEGEIIDMAMQDSVIPALATVAGAYYYMGRTIPPRTGSKHPALTLAPYNVYPTTDGYVSMICIRDGHWRALLRAIDREDLLEDEELTTMQARAENMDRVDEIVSDWTSGHSRFEVLTILQAEGVPVAPVRNIEEVLSDSHMHNRGMLRSATHEHMGEVSLMNSPLNIATGSRVEPALPPELGEHTDQTLTELAGLSDDELARLREEKIIQ